METLVHRTADFDLTGAGSAAPWNQAEWLDLPPLAELIAGYTTRAKCLYSTTGLYVLFNCEDRRLTCTLAADGADLYTEDVVEVFLWPDEAHSLYYEYEISPLGYQLSLLVPNCDGRFHGWLAWHDTGPRAIRRATAVRGGPRESMATVTGWTAEMFIPYDLLRGLTHVPPQPGTTWRGNFYRIDYDASGPQYFAWSKPSRPNFHETACFGRLRFA